MKYAKLLRMRADLFLARILLLNSKKINSEDVLVVYNLLESDFF